MCCGERFWTTQVEAPALREPERGGSGEPLSPLSFHPSAHRN